MQDQAWSGWARASTATMTMIILGRLLIFLIMLILAIGSSQFGPGYVRVFSLEGSDNTGNTGNWKQIGEDIMGEALFDEFGSSVSLSDDGKTIAIGAYGNYGINGDNSGHVRVYLMDDSELEWTQLGKDIDGEFGDYSGYSVTLSGDGNTVVIGTPHSSRYAQKVGQVRVFIVE